MASHHEIWTQYPSTSEVHAKVLQKLVVPLDPALSCLCAVLAYMLMVWLENQLSQAHVTLEDDPWLCVPSQLVCRRRMLACRDKASL